MYDNDSHSRSEIKVEELRGKSDFDQCEAIADHFCKISNLYDHLRDEDIAIDSIKNTKPLPTLNPWQIHKMISETKTGAATLKGDFPIKLMKEFSP